jgi:oligopeptide transport system substrate-binding protein
MKYKQGIWLCLTLFLLFSCNNQDNLNSEDSRSENAGGTIRIAEVTAPGSIFPFSVTNAIEASIASQIHEGLVQLNPKNMKVIPGLAEKWEIDDATKTITFHLRKGVKFQSAGPFANKTAPELTAKDVQFTFEQLCMAKDYNFHFATVCRDRIVGANESYEASKTGKKQPISGFKYIDDYTFSIQLLNSPDIFLQIIATPVASIISEKAFLEQGIKLMSGVGPFIYDEKNSNVTHHLLIRNPDYYAKDEKGNPLPYADSLIIDILPSIEEALIYFKDGKYDYLGSVPSNQLKQIVQDNINAFKGNPPLFVLERGLEMSNQYYSIDLNKAPLNNVKLRQAINYAIDKERIIEKVLFGQAYGAAYNGITPPAFEKYNNASVVGYSLDIAKAQKLMAEAGYPNGKGLPELQLIVNSGNSRNSNVAAEIQKQLKTNLNINVNFESLPNVDKFNLQVKGRGDLYRDGWVADYASPESFLSVFYGEPIPSDPNVVSFPNTIRYVNKTFDMYYKKGRDATTQDSAYYYFLKAEQVLMNDAPVIPLWYESNYRLISSRLKNFHVNPLKIFDFKKVSVTKREGKLQ